MLQCSSPRPKTMWWKEQHTAHFAVLRALPVSRWKAVGSLHMKDFSLLEASVSSETLTAICLLDYVIFYVQHGHVAPLRNKNVLRTFHAVLHSCFFSLTGNVVLMVLEQRSTAVTKTQRVSSYGCCEYARQFHENPPRRSDFQFPIV